MALIRYAMLAVIVIIVLMDSAKVSSGAGLCDQLRPILGDRTNAIVWETNSNLTFYGGAVITQNLMIFNGTLDFAPNPSNPSLLITVRSSVMLANDVTWNLLPGVHVDWDQSYAAQYPMYFFDSSKIIWSSCDVSHGRSPRLINVAFLCDSTDMTVYAVNTGVRNQANLSPFLYLDSKITLSQNVGPMYEVTLNDDATLGAFDNHPSLSIGTYFTVNSYISTPVVFPFPGVQTVIIPVGGMRANILNSSYVGGSWLRDGTDIPFVNSWLLLFPSWSAQSTYNNPVTGLHPYPTPTTRTITQGAITMRLNNSIVYLFNAYFGGGFMHRITDSIIGEMTCESPNTQCYAQNVTLDGAGGGLNAQDTTSWMWTGGSIAAVFTASGNSVSTFINTVFKPNPSKAALYLQANAQSAIVLADSTITVLSTPNSTLGYTLSTTDSGVILSARFIGWDSNVNRTFNPIVIVEPLGICSQPIAIIQWESWVYPANRGSTLKFTAYNESGYEFVLQNFSLPRTNPQNAFVWPVPPRSGKYRLVLTQLAMNTNQKVELVRYAQFNLCPPLLPYGSSSTGMAHHESSSSASENGGGGSSTGAISVASTGLNGATRISTTAPLILSMAVVVVAALRIW